MADLPPSPGDYALLLILEHTRSIHIGRLGGFTFAPGWYLYSGSGRGPGRLQARVRRHLGGTEHPHWHIDALRKAAQIAAVFYALEGPPLECAWSRAAAQLPGAQIPAPGFGAGDCRSACRAHLVALPPWIGLHTAVQALHRILQPAADSRPVQVIFPLEPDRNPV